MAVTTKRYWRKLALLAKTETDYGVSAAPTGAADAMQVSEVTLTPLGGEEVQRDIMVPYFGHQGVQLVGNYAEIKCSVELAGSGAAGTAPAYGPLLRACSMSETILATTSVTYAPVSSNPESVTLFANLDGVNHVILGARGTFTLSVAPKQIPKIEFTLRGLIGAIADTALPAFSLTKFQRPVVVSKDATTMSLHGYAAIAESISIDAANTVELRNLIGEDAVVITDRQSTGSAVIEAKALATKDWFTIAKARTRGALSVTHGTEAGNIMQIAAAAVEIGRPTYGQTQGVTNMTLPLLLCPTIGNDDFTIVVS